MIKYGDRISLTMITQWGVCKKSHRRHKEIRRGRIEIVIVDSDDQTAEIAKSLGANVFLQHPPKGYGPAMDHALKCSDRELIITVDCDDTYPLDQVDYFSKLIIEQNWCCWWNRLATNEIHACNKLSCKLWFCINCSLLFMVRIRLHSGMRAYKKYNW